MLRDFHRYGIRNDALNNGLPTNAIFRKDIQSIQESSEYMQSTNRQEQKEMIGEVLIEWVNCFLQEETHSNKITGMIISLSDKDFEHCIISLEIFRHKVNEALALLQSTVLNKSTSSSNNSLQAIDHSGTLNESSIHSQSMTNAAQGSNSFGMGIGASVASGHAGAQPYNLPFLSQAIMEDELGQEEYEDKDGDSIDSTQE